MEKNWLIRTKNNHILGPVSKEKVKELVENGSIKGDDEVCAGNGFWFFIREKEMVEKYLKGEESQEFNPMSEAETVLAKGKVSSDADYSNDITKLGISLDGLKEDAEAEASAEDKEQPEKKK